MSQRLWIAVAGVIGIGVAVLLIPRPDTGGDVTVAPVEIPTEGTAMAPAPEDDALPKRKRKKNGGKRADANPDLIASTPPARSPNTMVRPGGVVPNRVGVELTEGANPLAAAAAEKRNTPEAIVVGRVTAPWTQISRELGQKSGGGAEELNTETNQMIGTLREMRISPQDYDFAEIESKMTDLEKRIRDSGNSNDEIERMFGVINERMNEYKTAKSGQADG